MWECVNHKTYLFHYSLLLKCCHDDAIAAASPTNVNNLSTRGLKSKGMFLYSEVSSPLDRSKRVMLCPRADLFIPTPTWLLLEAF